MRTPTADEIRKLKDRAAVAANKGKLERAASLYREAADGDPRDIGTRQKLADVLRRAGRIPDAIQAYTEVAERFASEGLLIKAIAISKTILELDPERVETQAALAQLYSRRAASEGARPPPRTMVFQAMKAAAPAAPPPRAPTDERIVAISLGPPPPPALEPASEGDTPPEPEVLSFEIDADAPDQERTTGLARIVSAANAAIEAGVEASAEADVDEDILILSDEMETGLAEEDGATPAETQVSAGGSDEPLAPPDVEIDVAPEPTVATPPPAGERRSPAPAKEPPRQRPPAAIPQVPHPPRPRAPALPRVPIFSDLSPEAFLELTGGMVLHRVPEGEAVIREGEEGTSFYVVASGSLAVSKREEGGGSILLAHMREGDFFGEMALLSGAPRSATVTAEEDSEVLELRTDVLLQIVSRHPHLAGSLRRFYRQRLLASAMALSPIFRPFQRSERKLIMERFRSRRVAEKDVVIREGARSDGLYVILEGAVDVVKQKEGEDVVIGQLREGDLFGEMSCLRKSPASATVVVRRAGTLLRLPREDFDEMILSYPQILELVSTLSEERAENLDAILSGYAHWTEDGLVLT